MIDNRQTYVTQVNETGMVKQVRGGTARGATSLRPAAR